MTTDLHLVTFRVGAEHFGMPISDVQEIVRIPTITHIPHAPGFVEGVINLRGRVITVVDMRKRLGQCSASSSRHAGVAGDKVGRILVVEAGGKLVGVIVDEVAEVIRLQAEMVEPAPQMVAGLSNQYINGIGKMEGKLLILIDIQKILSAEDLAALDRMESIAA